MEQRERNAQGASAVEFALVVPFLLMIVFAIIGFGIIFGQQLSLGNSARQAARFGVVADRTCGDIKAEAKDAADTIGMDGDDTTVTVTVGQTEATATDPCSADSVQPCADSAVGDSVYVKLDFVSELIIPLVVMDNNFPIQGQGVFRCEFS